MAGRVENGWKELRNYLFQISYFIDEVYIQTWAVIGSHFTYFPLMCRVSWLVVPVRNLKT